MVNDKYLVKKTYEEIVDESKLEEIVLEYNSLIEYNTIYAYKNNKKIISFEPKLPYELEIIKIREWWFNV